MACGECSIRSSRARRGRERGLHETRPKPLREARVTRWLFVFTATLGWLLPQPRAEARSMGSRRLAVAHPRFDPRHLDAEIFARATRRSRVVGLVRRGSRVAVRAAVKGGGCPRGRWYPTSAGGYLCTAWGFRLDRPTRTRVQQPRFHAGRALPYRYVRSLRRRAPMLRRLPTEREARRIRRAVAGLASWPGVVLRRMAGAYFLAIGRRVNHGGRRFLQTVRGEYVRSEDVTPFPPAASVGSASTTTPTRSPWPS